MNNKEKVLSALIEVFKSPTETLDIMEIVNGELLNLTEIQFSETMYKLQEEGKISGAEFENDSPQHLTMWDNVKVHLANFEVYD